jgi:hypothetical protein
MHMRVSRVTLFPTRLAIASVRFTPIVFSCILLGCADHPPARVGDTSPSPAPSVGAPPTVANTAEAIAGAPAFTLIEELRVGGDTAAGTVEFGAVRDIDADSAGVIFVLDQNAVHVVDSMGRAIRRFGRRGQGPGEFYSPYYLAVHGDTVAVADDRVHLLTRQGDALATHAREGSKSLKRMNELQWTRAGWLVGFPVSGQPSPGPEQRPPARGTIPKPYSDTIIVRALDPTTGAMGEPIVRIVGQPTYILGEEGYLQTAFMAPEPMFAISTNGATYVTAGDDYIVDVFSADGALTRRIAGSVERIPVTSDDFDRWQALELEPYRGRPLEGEGKLIVEILRNDHPRLPRATVRPIVGRLLASDDGSLLLERLDLDPNPYESGDGIVWDFIDANGRIAGRLSTPATATLYRFIGDRVYARVRGEMNVAAVVRFRLKAAVSR